MEESTYLQPLLKNSKGIVKRGFPVTKKCVNCEAPFFTTEGTITIRGPIYRQIKCSKCIEHEREEFFQTYMMKAQN